MGDGCASRYPKASIVKTLFVDLSMMAPKSGYNMYLTSSGSM